MHSLTTSRGDAGSIVVGWLVKVAAVLLIIGVSAFDAISVGVARLNGSDDANTAASAAASTWQSTHNIDQTLLAAQNAITSVNEEVLPNSLSVAPDGTVHLSLRRKATTLVLYRIGPLKKYTIAIVKGEAGPPTG